ncbi:hypothetical protein U1Q18_033848 [Sarracenia purpurea var. burkii]
MNLLASHSTPLPRVRKTTNGIFSDRSFRSQRFSTVSEMSLDTLPEDGFLAFIESAISSPEGPYYCWLNKVEDGKDFSRRNGVFLVLVGAFLEDSLMISGCNPIMMFEKVKSLQQRYPVLHVIGFQYNSSIFSDAVHTRLAQITTKEYITFPIVLSSKNFSEVADRACFIVFKDFKSSFFYYGWDVDLGIIDRAIKELVQHSVNHGIENNLKSSWVKKIEVIKEPHFCLFLRNLLLYFPGCISADERGNRLFLSDINHHRIIIFDGNGKILDCIGSSPGFEDGEFESAKLMRPAASFYHATEDCLYFVDSEVCAQRADLDRRVLETIYPTCNVTKKNNNLWSWIMNKLQMGRDGSDAETKSEDLDSDFETLWIMDLASGVMKEAVKGFPKIWEICGQMILEKSSLSKQLPGDWMQQQVDNNCSIDGIPYAGLMSSLTTFQDHIVICDTVSDKFACEVCQRVLKLKRGSGSISSLNFSNFGILGLPYWVRSPLERFYVVDDTLLGVPIDHTECFSLLPGKIDIQLNVNIPEGTELVEPLQEGCVWRQARGAAIEVSGVESKVTSLEKVGVSQQWYDELDNLAFSTPEVELRGDDENTCDGSIQDGGVSIDCAVHLSPGTSELIVFAALYLKLKSNQNSCEDKEKKAARIADILNSRRAKKMERDVCFQFLIKSNRDLRELVFMKPMHVRLKFGCRDHPKPVDNSKDIVLTDSSIEVNVSLT